MQRDHWTSRFGFIMATAGSAVGLGNIWKFPYMVGAHGGGAFLVLYLVCVLGFGLSLVIAELAVGRMSRLNPVGAYRKVAGGAWPAVGALGVFTAIIILSFYCVVAGWTIAYLVYAIEGTLTPARAGGLDALFDNLIGSGLTPLLYAFGFVIATILIVARGVGGGIERASKLFMPLLMVLLLVMAVRALTLPGATDGLWFFLTPDFSALNGATASAALGQAFFSLSLGLGGLITYGSYMSSQQHLGRDALAVVLLDTGIAILAGLMIIPTMFAAGMTPDQGGPGTTFKVLPAVFASLPGGHWIAIGFFALLVLAALTSSISMLEPVVAYLVDERRVSRTKAAWLAGVICMMLAVPVSLSFGAWQGVTVFGMTLFGLFDYFASNLSLPFGGLMIAIVVGWILGPKAIAAIGPAGSTPGLWARGWLFVVRFIAPAGIVWILVQGLL
ncbi:MAG: sodium-dependent transporter [Xanthomonadales bacterium]|nr:sodium-dependent transporter [Xanthomonadales bacterium]|tara:strand:- start:976 stop:2307 length:1332 start_codon:yes stop_codon:yes gene_type:complete